MNNNIPTSEDYYSFFDNEDERVDKIKNGQCKKDPLSDCYECPDDTCIRQGDVPF